MCLFEGIRARSHTHTHTCIHIQRNEDTHARPHRGGHTLSLTHTTCAHIHTHTRHAHTYTTCAHMHTRTRHSHSHKHSAYTLVQLEKSPPDITKMRFLQAIMPEEAEKMFIVTMKHPLTIFPSKCTYVRMLTVCERDTYSYLLYIDV